jgi:hypothetical protein
MVNLLLKYGAHVNAFGLKYGSALQSAVHMRLKHVVIRLSEAGADPTLRGG